MEVIAIFMTAVFLFTYIYIVEPLNHASNLVAFGLTSIITAAITLVIFIILCIFYAIARYDD